ncbi:MAG: hypothetical protein RL033_5112 [Pseudomonadota bacterium]
MRSRSELPSPGLSRSGDEPTEMVAADGSSRNFSALVRAEFEWVWRLLRRIGLSAADADDATQQVFLVASRTEVHGSTRAFLYGTALRVAANARRGLRRRREAPSPPLDSAPAHEPPLDELLEQRRARLLLDQLLERLPDELRRVLVLAEIEELSAQQIAELEGIPTGTVASRLRRARASFHDLVAQEQARSPLERSRP